MSASQTPNGPTATATAGNAAGGDPSMEDILASIRRILSEDEAPAAGGSPPAAQSPGDGVLVLDPAMMVPDPAHEAEPVAHMPGAAAAASAVESLVRTLAERTMRVHSGGPTIEDIVREELRPMLKNWLDANLPALVERLVRAEIERVVGRTVP